jgi:hypothetical protein
MKMSCAPSTSAQPSAKERKTVLRAGTYVDGISPAIVASDRFFGTGAEPVSDEPPNARKSMSITTWRATR